MNKVSANANGLNGVPCTFSPTQPEFPLDQFDQKIRPSSSKFTAEPSTGTIPYKLQVPAVRAYDGTYRGSILSDIPPLRCSQCGIMISI